VVQLGGRSDRAVGIDSERVAVAVAYVERERAPVWLQVRVRHGQLANDPTGFFVLLEIGRRWALVTETANKDLLLLRTWTKAE